MTFNEYQLQAHGFADYTKPYAVIKEEEIARELDYTYPAMEIAEESGELIGKFAKAIRDKNGYISPEDKKGILLELGDICWGIAEICTIFNVSFESVCQMNIDKLTSRKKRNVIKGSGDYR